MDGWSNKLSLFLKGPRWQPGKPRLGYIDEMPDVSSDSLQLTYLIIIIIIAITALCWWALKKF